MVCLRNQSTQNMHKTVQHTIRLLRTGYLYTLQFTVKFPESQINSIQNIVQTVKLFVLKGTMFPVMLFMHNSIYAKYCIVLNE